MLCLSHKQNLKRLKVAMAIVKIQKKKRLTVAKCKLRNSTAADGGVLVSNKNSVKR